MYINQRCYSSVEINFCISVLLSSLLWNKLIRTSKSYDVKILQRKKTRILLPFSSLVFCSSGAKAVSTKNHDSNNTFCYLAISICLNETASLSVKCTDTCSMLVFVYVDFWLPHSPFSVDSRLLTFTLAHRVQSFSMPQIFTSSRSNRSTHQTNG